MLSPLPAVVFYNSSLWFVRSSAVLLVIRLGHNRRFALSTSYILIKWRAKGCRPSFPSKSEARRLALSAAVVVVAEVEEEEEEEVPEALLRSIKAVAGGALMRRRHGPLTKERGCERD